MTLLRAADIRLSLGSRTLFDGTTLVIDEGERVGLLGVNGSGKSTFMKVLAGEMKADAGELQIQRGARISYLPQDPVFPEGATATSELSVAQEPLRQAIARYEEIGRLLGGKPGGEEARLLEELSRVSTDVERLGGWNTEHEARRLLDRLGIFEWEKPLAQLSGGQRKRVALAKVLLLRPELLLLDEPTNHLDADTVEWLEEALDDLPGALVLVTHDRYFLNGLVDRIVEIEAGGVMVSYPGNYEAYLEQKLVRLDEMEVREHKRQRWIVNEVAWLRKGVEARRTKSRARIERARKLLDEQGFRRPKVPVLQVASAPRLGNTVVETQGISKGYEGKTLFQDVDLILRAGERVGIVGPNGVGKTTLLRVLLGELPPDQGTVEIGKNTKVAYFDQHRVDLDPEKTVFEAAWEEEWVEIGERKVHLRDYLEELLFPIPMQRMKVAALSGGERNRLLLARVLLEGANVLVLDEPTNDLDIVTLNLLESLLRSFGGTVLLVSHDRYFLDKVTTSILALEGDGAVVRYEGSYSMYRTLRPAASEPAPRQAPKQAPKEAQKEQSPVARPKRMGFKEQRELERIEEVIEAVETRKLAIEESLNDPSLYEERASEAAGLAAELEAATQEIEDLYLRWQELSTLAGG